MSEVQFELAREGLEAREPHGPDSGEPGRFAEALARFRRNRMAVTGVAVIVLIVLACAVGPFLVPYDPSAQDYDAISMAPSWAHPFGTDDLGRDLLARVLIGGRLSLFIGVVATLVALVIGVLYGAVAGFFGGWLDQLMMRMVDVLYSLPFLFFVIMLTMVVGRGVPAILLAIGALLWLTVAVIVRGQALGLRGKEFVEAARAGGMKPFAIVWRHIVPNSLGPVIAYASLLVPGVIMGESFLSYLGLGISEPAVTWGTLISDGTSSMDVEPWKIAFPAAALALTLLSLNFIADGLRDALDPKDR